VGVDEPKVNSAMTNAEETRSLTVSSLLSFSTFPQKTGSNNQR